MRRLERGGANNARQAWSRTSIRQLWEPIVSLERQIHRASMFRSRCDTLSGAARSVLTAQRERRRVCWQACVAATPHVEGAPHHVGAATVDDHNRDVNGFVKRPDHGPTNVLQVLR
jgi:hypothetical protein